MLSGLAVLLTIICACFCWRRVEKNDRTVHVEPKGDGTKQREVIDSARIIAAASSTAPFVHKAPHVREQQQPAFVRSSMQTGQVVARAIDAKGDVELTDVTEDVISWSSGSSARRNASSRDKLDGGGGASSRDKLDGGGGLGLDTTSLADDLLTSAIAGSVDTVREHHNKGKRDAKDRRKSSLSVDALYSDGTASAGVSSQRVSDGDNSKARKETRSYLVRKSDEASNLPSCTVAAAPAAARSSLAASTKQTTKNDPAKMSGEASADLPKQSKRKDPAKPTGSKQNSKSKSRARNPDGVGSSVEPANSGNRGA